MLGVYKYNTFICCAPEKHNHNTRRCVEERAMAIVVAYNFIFTLQYRLLDIASSIIGSSLGVHKELKKLQSTLLTIQAVLEDAEARQVKEKSLKVWLRKLKDVVFDADDMSDRVVVEDRKFESSKIKKARRFLNSFSFRSELARSIEEIRERLDEIAKETPQFLLQERVIVKEEIGIVREETGSFVHESEVYGREEDREKIIEYLINNKSSPSADDLGVMPIVGLGGLGKTTVARLVYNDERIRSHFVIRMWVHVSDDFDTKRIYKSIIQSMGKSDMESLERTIIEELRGKRFFVVMDDVWDKNHINWNRLRSLLRNGATGSKILVTTRIEKVAYIMGTVPPYYLSVLSEADCWKLFEERAFGLGGANKTPSLLAIGKDIVKKCGGVPLAATALGSLMRFKRRESYWQTIEESELWELTDDDNVILPALMFSYNHLPSRLKQCFAYCSIFPKDYEIHKEKLVQLWLAEGFIRSSDENTNLEDIGFQYVDELLSRSLLQNGPEDCYGVIVSVKMHVLVHDLARSIAGEECLIVDASTRERFFQGSRYSSFLLSEDISAILEILNQANKLRTFHLITSEATTEEEQIRKLLYVIFSELKLLRALHLGGCPIKDLPHSVSNLGHLRYLDLTCAHFEILPSCIGTLHNLQTLILTYCTRVRELPDSIGDLRNLLILDLGHCYRLLSLPSSIGQLTRLRKLNLKRCESLQALPESVCCLQKLQVLNLESCSSLICMPAGLGQLSHLRTLPMYVLAKINQCSLGELGGLNLLEGNLEISNLENVRNVAEARCANLREKHRLRFLELKWNSSEPPEMQDRGGYVVDFQEDVLDSLQPHTNLEKLTINGYLGRKFPSWMLESSIPNLVELSLISCFSCERLPPLGQLPKLKTLFLSKIPAVKVLGFRFYGGDGAFPLLETLYLESMPALEEWSWATATGGEIFPSLSSLTIRNCPKLKALPSTFSFVTHLEINADHGLMLSALKDQNGAFPNLKSLRLSNNNFGSFGDLPQVIKERMASINNWTDAHLTQLNSIPLDSLVDSCLLNKAISSVQLN